MRGLKRGGKLKALVAGAGGFIGHHMVSRLKKEGYEVVGVDLKNPSFEKSAADQFFVADLRDESSFSDLLSSYDFDEIYQFAADMGGAGYVFSGEADADIMHNSALININLATALMKLPKEGLATLKVFYSSSACMYPEYNQTDPSNPKCSEESAYPAAPDSEYGWEKLFSERFFASLQRNYGANVRIARYHNIYGPLGTYAGGKEKAPAAICRKIAEIDGQGEIEVWGDGEQTRSFLFIDDCIEATRRLMQSDFDQPVNIGSEEMVSINELVHMVAQISSKTISKRHVLSAPVGVRGRNSDNKLIRSVLDWDYKVPLVEGLQKTYEWIEGELSNPKEGRVGQ